VNIEPAATTPSVTPAQTATEATAQADAAAADAAREARVKAVERARRGLAGTIATSDRGVLSPLPTYATRKTLLGE
jgi:hypothetical protein